MNATVLIHKDKILKLLTFISESSCVGQSYVHLTHKPELYEWTEPQQKWERFILAHSFRFQHKVNPGVRNLEQLLTSQLQSRAETGVTHIWCSITLLYSYASQDPKPDNCATHFQAKSSHIYQGNQDSPPKTSLQANLMWQSVTEILPNDFRLCQVDN